MLYKLINKVHYKEGKTINTEEVNYSTSVTNHNKHENYYNYIEEKSKALAVGIDIFVTIANGINVLGQEDIYRSFIRNGSLDLTNISSTAKRYPNKIISQKDFFEICSVAFNEKARFTESADGARLWEFFYEKARKDSFPECPSRLESYFAFPSQNNIKYYKEKHGASGMECKIDASMCHTAFEADMRLLDLIKPHQTHPEALKKIQRYWQQKESSKPVKEVLLQGNVTLREKI